jgi:hypothetical protein
VIVTNTSGADQFNQRLVVDEYTGELGLIYYSTAGAGSRLATQVWFQRSNDNGLTWSPAVQLTTSPTNETVAGADLGNQYGDYNGLSGYRGVFLSSWTDRRSGGAEEIWTALMHTQPVLHLSFDDQTDVGIDDSGNGHDGTLAAATVIQGQCGNALHFLPNNNVQEFSVPHSSALDMVGPMTGIAWVSAEGQQSTDNNPSCTEGTIFAKEGANWFQVEKDSWTQVAFVREADGHTVQFYQNGAPLGSPHNIPTFAFTNPAPLMIGNYGFQNDPGACEFNGGLDEIKIYDVALPASSILSEYAEVLACVQPGKHSKPGNGPCAGDPNCPEPILYTPRTGLTGARDSGTDTQSLTLRAEPALLRAQTRFQLSRFTAVRGAITIHDIAGRTVQTLEVPATTGSVWWDGRDAMGRRVRPGVYLARLEEGGAVAQARVIVVQ